MPLLTLHLALEGGEKRGVPPNAYDAAPARWGWEHTILGVICNVHSWGFDSLSHGKGGGTQPTQTKNAYHQGQLFVFSQRRWAGRAGGGGVSGDPLGRCIIFFTIFSNV